MRLQQAKIFEKWEHAPLSWQPDNLGRVGPVSWNDHLHEELGFDPDGFLFCALADRVMHGRYYPPDVIEFFGRWQDEGRKIRKGERILQIAHLPLGIRLPVMTEIYIAVDKEDYCEIGYVTTKHHFGKGRWHLVAQRQDGRVTIDVDANSGPGSFWFWVGLPIARWFQMKAWRKAIESYSLEASSSHAPCQSG